jgi:hypothetical protein
MTEKSTRVIRQLFALALDLSASAGEVANAGQKIVEFLRKEGATMNDLAELFGSKALPPPQMPSPDYLSMAMPFGKYKGLTLGWIVEHQPDYLDWVLENCDHLRPRLRSAIERVLEECAPS